MKTITFLFAFIISMLSMNTYAQDLEIYVSDAGNFSSPPWKILKYDENGENPEVFISDSIVWPQDIVFLEDQGVVLISSLKTNGYISKHDISTGEFVDYFAEGIAGPTRMKIGEDSLLYVLQWSASTNAVLRFELDGTPLGDFTSTGVSQSIGLDWDDEGNLYVSSWGGKFVQKFDPDGVDLGTFIDSNLSGPTNIWFDDNGDLLVIDYSGGAVKRFDADGNYVDNFVTGLSAAEGIAWLPNGNMLIGNGNTHSVKMFNPDGNYIEDFIENGSGGLITPNAVVVRDVTQTVGIQAKEVEEIFIVPTTGTQFYIHDDLFNSISAVEVYDTAGIMVNNTKFNGKKIWDASTFQSGVYIIVVKTKDGDIKSNKVIVQK